MRNGQKSSQENPAHPLVHRLGFGEVALGIFEQPLVQRVPLLELRREPALTVQQGHDDADLKALNHKEGIFTSSTQHGIARR